MIIGDARLADTLERAGGGRARALVAVTPDDATNLAVGLAVKQVNPKVRTVVQLLEPNFARKAQSALDVDVSLSAPFIAGPTFAAAALYPGVLHAFIQDRWLCALVSQVVGPDMAGLTAHQVNEGDGLLPLLAKSASASHFAPLGAGDLLTEGSRIIALRSRRQSVAPARS